NGEVGLLGGYDQYDEVSLMRPCELYFFEVPNMMIYIVLKIVFEKNRYVHYSYHEIE
ncbi:MAG: hypothetical protein ACD_45C00011G0002, partial [uncultured bacterium]